MNDLAVPIVVPVLETPRLRLRAFDAGDVDAYAALNADAELRPHHGPTWQDWDRGRSWRHLAFLVGHWQLAGAGVWAAELKATGEFLGWVGFAEPEGWPGFELAGILARRFWGRGLAEEGARAALAYAFDVLQKDHVISLIHPDNARSLRVAEKIGETLEGTIQHVDREMFVYGIRRETWRSLSAPWRVVLAGATGEAAAA